MTTKKATPIKDNPGFDLITAVADMLTSVGLHKEVLTAYYTNHWIAEAKTFPAEGQRLLLNRYWNQQLLNCEANTVPQRFCLIPNGTIEDWLRLFQGKIVPVCMEYKLPAVL